MGRNLAIGALRPASKTNIAAGLRRNARDTSGPLDLLGTPKPCSTPDRLATITR
ncbi:hypothetical protein [Streptomyces sp. NPDC056479]|uniref:hypothetical protein n=1 Tax=unclassified Streptomyces TaxID=2593676 RepID=UPI00369E5A5F